ncbi:MAG: hypothetical protein LBT09_04350 [Planctomycetaceae bacterium]|jgi:hypothetical protein|nr:hypothetical protein [Planctomycetaceae bacterium]
MARFFDNILNPLLVRELRQFVRNKFIIVLINVYVLAIVVACLIVLMSLMDDGLKAVGNFLFMSLGYIVFIVSLLAVVMRTVFSTSTDRSNEDLMFFSSMKPSTIVWGKILSGIIITLVLMSVTMPFVTMAFLLRGLDLQTVVIVFSQIFALIQILNSLAIFRALSGNPKTVANQTSSFIVILFFVIVFNGSLLFPLYMRLLRMIDSSVWVSFIYYMLCAVAILALLICGSISVLSPPSSNRMFPMRILLTLIFLLSVIVTAVTTSFSTVGSLIHNYSTIEYAALIALCFILLVTVCERDQWSIRIRRGMPKSILLRVIVFPFYSGAACGIVWVLMMVLFIYVLEVVMIPDGMYLKVFQITFDIGNGKMSLPIITGLLIFTFNYAVTAMLIRSWLFKRADSGYVKLIMFFLLVFFSFISFLIYFVAEININKTSGEIIAGYPASLLSALNPFCDILEANSYGTDIAFGNLRIISMTIWMILLFIVLIVWYAQRIRNFSANFKEPLLYEEARELVQKLENPHSNNNPKN